MDPKKFPQGTYFKISRLSEKQIIPNGFKYVFGNISGISGNCVVQPLDLVKTRMQVQGEGTTKKEYRSTWHCITSVVKKEGPLALYRGMSAGILRQATYTTARLGAYQWMVDFYRQHSATEPPLFASMAMGVVAGAIGAFVGTPADLALVRMAADGRLPADQRRNYKNVMNALVRITREEGVLALWKGGMPTVGRAMIINMTQLASYSQFKRMLKSELEMQDGIVLVISASMLSGVLTTLTSMPLDLAKTRLQSMTRNEYRGTLDVLMKVMRREGPLALWKGFTPYYCRLGPLTVLIFVFLEEFNNMYYKYVAKSKRKTTSGL